MRKRKRERKELIAIVNDVFRRRGTGFMVTPGIQTLVDIPGVVEAIRNFDSFNEASDPHGEHDFGSIEWHGNRVFWKIDYYDWALEYGEDPLSPRCKRVLTIMLASEY